MKFTFREHCALVKMAGLDRAAGISAARCVRALESLAKEAREQKPEREADRETCERGGGRP